MGHRRWAEAEAKIFCTQEQVRTAEFPEKQEGFFEACVFTTSLLREIGCLQPQMSWRPDFFADFCEVGISLMDFWPIKKNPDVEGKIFSIDAPQRQDSKGSKHLVIKSCCSFFLRASSLEGGGVQGLFLGLLRLRPAKRHC